MEELFKFDRHVEAITEAHANGDIEAERAKGVEGIQWIEDACTPSYDPERGEAVESRTFADLVRQHANTPGGEYAFIEATERHARAIIIEADNFIDQSNENTPQGKYMRKCRDMAEVLIDEAEKTSQRFGIIQAESQTITSQEPYTQGRKPMLGDCSKTLKKASAELFVNLVSARVFITRNQPEDLKTFKAFLYGEDAASVKGKLTVNDRTSLKAFIYALATAAKEHGAQYINTDENLQKWVIQKNGKPYTKDSLKSVDKQQRTDIKEAVKKAFEADERK